MPLYRDQFCSQHDFPQRKPEKFLIIASTPRCGSHMLGHTLHETGRFGFPLEYAHPGNLAEWRRICGTAGTHDTLEAIARRRTSSNGVFSIKLHYSHLESLGGFEAVEELFPGACFVLLTRGRALRQAVSLAIAAQTGVWIAGQDDDSRPPTYDHEQIDRSLRRILRDNASWRYALAVNGCRYLDLDFDTAKADIATTVERIAQFAGVSLAGANLPEAPVTRAQGSVINDQWEARFLAEHKGGVLFGPDRVRRPGWPGLLASAINRTGRLVRGRLSLS